MSRCHRSGKVRPPEGDPGRMGPWRRAGRPGPGGSVQRGRLAAVSRSAGAPHRLARNGDDIEQAAKEFKAKNARILRENRDQSGKLTTIFVQDPHGLEMEIRSAR